MREQTVIGGRNVKAVILIVVLLGAFATAAISSPPRVAHACSAGPDFNPARDSDLIVAGTITDVEIVGRTGVMTFLELLMTFEVDEYLRGNGVSTLEVLDGASAVPLPELTPNSSAFAALDLSTLDVADLRYDGSGGACGALDEDPRGRYWVIGLGRHPDSGDLRSDRLRVFAVGISADDPVVVDGIARVRSLLAEVAPPVVGDSGNLGVARGRDHSPPRWVLVTLVAGTLVVVAVGRVTSVAPRH